MADRFYTSSVLGLGPVLLQGAEAHHLAAVRRFTQGDLVVLFNGDGHEYPAEVVAVAKKNVALEILRVESPRRESSVRLMVAAPLPKGDRGDFLIEKLTELGVTDFVPLRTQRSIVTPNVDKLRRAVIEASKQCGRNVLMCVHPITNWDEFCLRDGLSAIRTMAHTGAVDSMAPVAGEATLAVGPEGGFTEQEVALARDAGWKIVTLGPRTLRVETAALALALTVAFTATV